MDYIVLPFLYPSGKPQINGTSYDLQSQIILVFPEQT